MLLHELSLFHQSLRSLISINLSTSQANSSWESPADLAMLCAQLLSNCRWTEMAKQTAPLELWTQLQLYVPLVPIALFLYFSSTLGHESEEGQCSQWLRSWEGSLGTKGRTKVNQQCQGWKGPHELNWGWSLASSLWQVQWQNGHFLCRQQEVFWRNKWSA